MNVEIFQMNLRTYQIKSNHLWKMAMEQGLNAQVVMILQKESDNEKKKWKDQEYNFQGQSAISRRWFDLDNEWLEENLSIREPHFYLKMYQTKFRGNDTKTYKIFGVPIGNAKISRKVQFQPAAPVIIYYQKTSYSCCLISLASHIYCIGDNRSVPALVNRIEE